MTLEQILQLRFFAIAMLFAAAMGAAWAVTLYTNAKRAEREHEERNKH